jgi:urease accessory protein
MLLAGRKHHGDGELFEYDLYSSTVSAARPDGTALFTEKFVAEPWRHPLRRAGVMGRFDVFANVTLVTPRRHAERVLDHMTHDVESGGDCMAGVSRLPNDAGLAYKVLGTETEPVKEKVRAFWRAVRQEVRGAPIPAPPLWG